MPKKYDHYILGLRIIKISSQEVMYETKQDLTDPIDDKMFNRADSAARRIGNKIGDKVKTRSNAVNEWDVLDENGKVIERLICTAILNHKGKKAKEESEKNPQGPDEMLRSMMKSFSIKFPKSGV